MNIKPLNILEALVRIVEKAENSKLSDDFFKENHEPITFAAKKLKLSPKQAVFLAIFIDQNDESNISLSQIAEFVGMRPMHLLLMSDEIEGLVKKRYIKVINGTKSTYYRVPKEVVKALTHNKPYEYHPPQATDLVTFFDLFKKLLQEKENSELDYNSFLNQTNEYLNCIPQSSLARGLKRYKLNEERAFLFIYMAYLLIEDSNEDIRLYEIENIYDGDEIPGWCKSELRNRTSPLFHFKLIENTFEDGVGRSDAFKLTEKAKYELLADMNLRETGKSDNGLVKYDSFPGKKLFYNSGTIDKIKELRNILAQRNFSKVRYRLKEAGLRSGFCCLFYGAPGTGKTETVYQLARETKRNIMQVDVDKIKSCWVGESEKNIKALFDRYRVICKNSTNLPILLFNEADAVLGVRMEGASKAVDKMENSLQNIILQEMENLEGIMIATTNLTTNLDKAFERRFLYKIKYDRPQEDARVKIWKSLMPGLRNKEARILAKDFELSGGEIENIARKSTVNSILSGSSKLDLEYIRNLILDEHLKNSNYNRIGFEG